MNRDSTHTVAAMKEKWVHHMEEKLESRWNAAHAQTRRKRMFSSVPSDLTERELVAQV